MTEAIHDPDQFMVDLRLVLSQGRKRIGVLLGAGIPTSLRVNDKGELSDGGTALIPDVAGLTEFVLSELNEEEIKVINAIKGDLKPKHNNPNIEGILSRVRLLSQVVGNGSFHGLDGKGFENLSKRICDLIGNKVNVRLPQQSNPYSEFVSWLQGTSREHPVEVFTPNYDLLLEEAFEKVRAPYFDGFTGTQEPFFDSASVINNDLPPRWTRLWKMHGSLGWESDSQGNIVRTGKRTANHLIYPDHLKYDTIQKMPYTALLERLRSFILTPDTLLICCGFSFFDAHISSVICDALSANANSAVFAFQFKALENEKEASELAFKCPNLSVYAKDKAIINGVPGTWIPGVLKNDWSTIRLSYWGARSNEEKNCFLLGDFARFSQFVAMAQASKLIPEIPVNENETTIDKSISGDKKVGS